MISNKKDLRFISRTRVSANDMFNDAKAYLISTYNKASTVFTSASPFAQILKVMSELTELILYYIEDATVEQNIATATNKSSIYGLARLTGHNPTRGISAIGEIKIRYMPEVKLDDIAGDYIFIPNRAKLKLATNGLIYSISDNLDYIKMDKTKLNRFVSVKITQGIFDKQTVTGTGKSMQSFNIDTQGRTDHHEVTVTVNGKIWPNFDSLYDMRRNTEGCLIKTGISGGIDIFFGNNHFGKIPDLGSVIDVEYINTDGSRGNVADSADVFYMFEDEGFDSLGAPVDLNEFLVIETKISPKMGANSEDTNFTKVIAPYASRNFTLSHPRDFEYFLSRYDSFSHIEAYNTAGDDNLEDDNIIYLNILPDVAKKIYGTYDYFQFPEEEFTLSPSEMLMLKTALNKSGQLMIGSEVQFIDQHVTRYAVELHIRYWNNTDPENIYYDIRKSLSEYFLNNKRKDRIPRSDITGIVEDIEGVDSLTIQYYSQDYEALKQIPNANLEQLRNKYFDKLGDIRVQEGKFPIIRGGWVTADGIEVIDEPYYMIGNSESEEGSKMYSLKVVFDEALTYKSNIRIKSSQ